MTNDNKSMIQSNFQFLKTQWPAFYTSAREAEETALRASRSSIIMARYSLEQVVNWLYNHDEYLRRPYSDKLGALIHEQTFMDNLAPGLFVRVRFIWQNGNFATHKAQQEQSIDSQLAVICLTHLHAVLAWFYKFYSRDTSAVVEKFDEALLPDKAQQEQNSEAIRTLQAQLEQTNVQLKEQAAENSELKTRIRAVKEQNRQKVEQTDFNPDKATEEQTRWYLIDLLLDEAGWDHNEPNVREYEVRGMPNKSGVGHADYVLWGADGLPLAVVEAKRTMRDSREGKHQACLYADCLAEMTSQRPLIFYTNGYEIYFWDDTRAAARPVLGFYSQDELALAINRRSTLQLFSTLSPSQAIAGRYYQLEAVTRACEAYENGSRKALLVMATGTGKTRVAISITDMLLRAHWAKRILFLADRNALLRQARKHFKKHLPHISTVDITDDKEDLNTRLIFSTYPTMLNMLDERREERRRFGVAAFDLVIIDEVHRSIYAKYRTIFQYFDSLLLGLTATPKSDIDHNTYEMCDLEDQVPTFAYEYGPAVSDKFLVPYRALSVPIKFQQEGIKYAELTEAEKQEYEEKFYDDENEALPDKIGSAQLNTWVFNQDTVDKVLTYLMNNGLKVKGGDRLGKTIIFAKNHNHAMYIAERFDALYPHLKGKFLQVIDNQIPYAHDLIDKFYLKDENPIISVSVDMLDTGIDVPEVLNLVFFKIVRSKSKFWQMIGRGTRLCENLFAPGVHKEYFLIFDFCENFEFFAIKPEGYVTPLQESLSAEIFLLRLQLAQLIRKPARQKNEQHRQYYTHLIDLLHTEVRRIAAQRGESIQVRAHRRQLDRFCQPEAWQNLTKTDLHDLKEHIAPLIIPQGDDELARRFDLLILNLQIAMLDKEPQETHYIRKVQNYAFILLDTKLAIPAVAAHRLLLQDVASTEYWKKLHVANLEEVRVALRELIKFMDRSERLTVYTHFEDVMGDASEPPEINAASGNLTNYRRKVEAYIRQHKDYLVIRKLIYNESITTYDLDQLEHFLFNGELGSKADFEKAFPAEKSLGRFIRSIVGLDRSTAKEIFAAYLDQNRFDGNQITFINQIIDFLTQQGSLEPSRLFEIPFDQVHSAGISGVFAEAETDKIIQIIQGINLNAEATGA